MALVRWSIPASELDETVAVVNVRDNVVGVVFENVNFGGREVVVGIVGDCVKEIEAGVGVEGHCGQRAELGLCR